MGGHRSTGCTCSVCQWKSGDGYGALVKVRTSRSSGYVTVKQNVSDKAKNYLYLGLVIPAGHQVMVSFEQLTWTSPAVHIYIKQSRHSAVVLVWAREMLDYSDFAQVLRARVIVVRACRQTCLLGPCFKLFYTFFPRQHALQTLATGWWNLWNCSVEDYYRSFHHHLACNLKAECEDGRDETERCPFSSPDCQGLVDLCGRCYSFTRPMYRVVRGAGFEEAGGYCESFGGRLGFPKCLPDWFGALRRMKMIHEDRLAYQWVGLVIGDVTLPALYRHVIVGGRTAHYHAVRFSWSVPVGEKKCLTTTPNEPGLEPFTCGSRMHYFGSVCEFEKKKKKKNGTENLVVRSEPVSLTRALSVGGDSVTVCGEGHATHAFLLCGSGQYGVCGDPERHPEALIDDRPSCVFGSSPSRVAPVPLFACRAGTPTLSYTLVCDFITDCQDESDESFCQHPPCVLNTFVCTTGRHLYDDSLCVEMLFRCRTEESSSYEQKGRGIRSVTVRSSFFPSPALITFDGVGQFVSMRMDSNESCPDTHYRCPGEVGGDCLPVYTRCNTMYDCVDRQDEQGCEDTTCPGFFRCRASTICVHGDHLCDGWSHCPMHDDELACDVTCPAGCQCQGHAFLCHVPFSAALFPQLRCLDATGSGMTLSDVGSNTYLVHLVLVRCSLVLLPDLRLLNLRSVDFSDNRLRLVNLTSFAGSGNLQALSLSDNPLTSLRSSVLQQSKLSDVDLSFTTLTVLDAEAFSSFPRMQILNLTFTSIHTIGTEGFRSTPELTDLYMEGSPVETFPPDLFQDLSRLRIVSSQNYKLCCGEILPHYFDSKFCYAPKDEVSSCEDLLQSWSYRVFLWLITCLSLTGNVFCFCARLFGGRSTTSASAFGLFVTNLTMADFLMGVYNAVIGAADERFRGGYLRHDDAWKGSVACRVAGFLSLLSSEVSALVILLITLDRFVVLHFPFTTLRFERTSAAVACVLAWLAGWALAVLPLLPVTSHWEFYSQTGICIPLPVTRREFAGRAYSFGVIIVLNCALFLLISAGQGFIYWSVQSNTLRTSSSKMSRDMTIARRLITVAATDFMCWFPIGLCGMLAAAGVPVSGEINVALAVFVLPLNSAVNPFLYTFNTLAEKRRKSKEAKFMSWLESHAHVLSS